jgi:hypothetical protein
VLKKAGSGDPLIKKSIKRIPYFTYSDTAIACQLLCMPKNLHHKLTGPATVGSPRKEGGIMNKKSKAKKPGIVRKVIKPVHPSLPEKAEIAVEGADELYREIRIENTLEDEKGEKVRLKPGAEVEVIVEADKSATEPKHK